MKINKRAKQFQCVLTPCQAGLMPAVRVLFPVTAANMMDAFCVPVSLQSHSDSIISPSSGPYSPSQSFTTYHLNLFRLLTHKRWSVDPKHIISHTYSDLLCVKLFFYEESEVYRFLMQSPGSLLLNCRHSPSHLQKLRWRGSPPILVLEDPKAMRLEKVKSYMNLF